MPGFDRTGPMGAGPMSGRARGWCNSRRAGVLPNYSGAGFGGAFGFRRGLRRGGRWSMGPGRAYGPADNWYPPLAPTGYAMEPVEELEYLKQQAREMSASLEAINRRIDGLSQKPSESEEPSEAT